MSDFEDAVNGYLEQLWDLTDDELEDIESTGDLALNEAVDVALYRRRLAAIRSRSGETGEPREQAAS